MLARLALAALTAALLFAGQAALLHPLQHVDKHGALVHAGDRHSGDHKDSSGNLCDALAALIACVPDAPRVLAVADQVDLLPTQRQAAPRTAEAPPFLSQGPPALL